MNEIVRHARMVRMPGKLRFKDRRRLQCPGKCLVRGRLTRREIKRVEYQGFIVVFITRGERFIGVGQRSDAIALQSLGEAIVVGRDGVDDWDAFGVSSKAFSGGRRSAQEVPFVTY